MKKIIFISLGFLFIAVGVLGIFLPVLPTTIFLIIASYFFMKSSPELNEKLMNNKYLGKYIRNYKEKKGMPLKSKISSIILLWTSILASSYFFTENTYIQLLLIAIAVGVTIHIASLKTLVNKNIQEEEFSTE
jgi:uncharacterized membrane protein YbaN (DUF454 family)